MKTTLIAFVAAILVGVGVFLAMMWYYDEEEDAANTVVNNSVSDDSDDSSSLDEFGVYNTKDYDYDLVDAESFPVQQSITRKESGSDEAETIVTNAELEEAIPELAETERPSRISELSEPDESKYVYYRVVLDGTEDQGRDIYEFDTEKETFRKMDVSDDVQDELGGLSFSMKTSPDGTMIAIANDLDEVTQDLYVINLENDVLKKLVSVTGDESLDGADGGLSAYIKLDWEDSDTISYEVFDSSEELPGYDGANQKYKTLETRTVDVE